MSASRPDSRANEEAGVQCCAMSGTINIAQASDVPAVHSCQSIGPLESLCMSLDAVTILRQVRLHVKWSPCKHMRASMKHAPQNRLRHPKHHPCWTPWYRSLQERESMLPSGNRLMEQPTQSHSKHAAALAARCRQPVSQRRTFSCDERHLGCTATSGAQLVFKTTATGNTSACRGIITSKHTIVTASQYLCWSHGIETAPRCVPARPTRRPT